MVSELPTNLSFSPILIMGIFIGLAVLPFLLMAVTSFVKLSVVFAILRSALGAGQIPSAAISGLLSVVLTVFIMSPVFLESIASLEKDLGATETKKSVAQDVKSQDLQKWFEVITNSAEPLRLFLLKHSEETEREFFANFHKDLSRSLVLNNKSESCQKDNNQNENCLFEGETFFSLLPAFLLTELKESFAIGFVLFLPFLIIDLVVANILVGLGMMMVSPAVITLPLKILLFVLCDGWFLLSRGLILGYLA